MKIIKSINRLNKEVNFKANIGFVPTMGALHKGHISLIESSKKKCDKTIVSIFVNPSQFNEKNDYKKYPKNIFKDLKILNRLKVDYVLFPKKKQIYKNKKQMKISFSKKYKILCAKYRKGHFEGVLGVIKRLLEIVKAKYMFLGEKDYQQVFLIKNFIKNKFNTKIITVKTIRDKNMLAFSSRNQLLKKKELKIASIIAKKMKRFHVSVNRNFLNKKKLYKLKNEIENLASKIEYLEIRNKYTLSKKINKSNFKLFLAYYINGTRLIDNF